MALLAYQIEQIDITLWGTLTRIKANTYADAYKLLNSALDPQTDPTILRKEEAYRFE
jgi:hypothetical protein